MSRTPNESAIIYPEILLELNIFIDPLEPKVRHDNNPLTVCDLHRDNLVG
jgi:hypothetical protein